MGVPRPGQSPGKAAVSNEPGRWPLVSVILPTRGRSELVRQALSAVVGVWLPTEIAVAHYSACDRLELGDTELTTGGVRSVPFVSNTTSTQ